MTRHIIDRGILATIHAFDGGGCVVLSRDGALADYTVTRGTACALASSGLLGADVEVCLSRAGETTPADGERARYMAASADVARLERELAAASAERDALCAVARHLADGLPLETAHPALGCVPVQMTAVLRKLARPAADDAGALRAERAGDGYADGLRCARALAQQIADAAESGRPVPDGTTATATLRGADGGALNEHASITPLLTKLLADVRTVSADQRYVELSVSVRLVSDAADEEEG